MSLWLPRFLPRSSGRAEVAECVVRPHGTLSRGSGSVLVVEDKAELASIVKRQLEALGYRVQVAGDGPSALEIVHGGGHFDLLFTDVVMPGGNERLSACHDWHDSHVPKFRSCSPPVTRTT